LTNPDYWRSPNPSSTFHGRDIFAPVGAHLANGANLEQLGTAIDLASLVEFPLASLSVTDKKIVGAIQYIDGYGNLITNIPAAALKDKRWSVAVANRVIILFCHSGESLGSSQLWLAFRASIQVIAFLTETKILSFY
jgi:hypothetical protein